MKDWANLKTKINKAAEAFGGKRKEDIKSLFTDKYKENRKRLQAVREKILQTKRQEEAEHCKDRK